MKNLVLNALDFAGAASRTGGIQEALDALPASGGVVYLPPGRYPLRRSVLMRSGVTLRGEGPATVLTRPKEIVVPVTKPTDGSRQTLHVARTDRLRLGDQICITDGESCGWWCTHALVRDIRRTNLRLDLRHGERRYRYLPKRHAFAANWFPAFWLRKLRDVAIENLTIDGGVRRHRRESCEFVVAAIHSRNCEDLRVAHVTVRNWLGDGIGVQGGRGALVTGCVAENCCGHGFHPGTSVTQSIWSDNIGRGNTRDGLFFCLRVTHTTVTGSVFVGNGGHGIGGLTDPDRNDVVASNVCAENGKHGIDADRALGDVIQGNICRNNSRSAPGKYAGIFLAGHRNCVVTGNLCIDDQARPTQMVGLVNREPAGPNLIANNECVGGMMG